MGRFFVTRSVGRWLLCGDNFWLWWRRVFAGGFGENACFVVVFWWCECGGLRGWCGVLAVTFLMSENTPSFFEFIFLFACFAARLSCRTGRLRGARSLRDLYTFSCRVACFGPPVGRVLSARPI
jgi:hypothetical protein